MGIFAMGENGTNDTTINWLGGESWALRMFTLDCLMAAPAAIVVAALPIKLKEVPLQSASARKRYCLRGTSFSEGLTP